MPAPRRPGPGGQQRVFNVVESPTDIWDAIKSGRLRDVEPPDEVELHKERWYDVADQKQTGSCIGWALADSVMRLQLVKEGRLRQNQRLSARFIWMASKEWQAQRLGRDRATLGELLPDWQPSTFLEEATTAAKDALEVARHLGVVTEPMLRWDGPLNRGPERTFWERAAHFKLEAYYSVTAAGRDERLRRWRQWISQHGPLMVVVAIDSSLLDGDRILSRFRPRRRADLHACALVGYRGERFILRNSWGTDWADKGYALAEPEWLARAVRESYGVLFPRSAAADATPSSDASSSARERSASPGSARS
jgi:Papain family cysteine protease